MTPPGKQEKEVKTIFNSNLKFNVWQSVRSEARVNSTDCTLRLRLRTRYCSYCLLLFPHSSSYSPPSTQSLLAVALLQWEWKGSRSGGPAADNALHPAVNWVGQTMGPTHPPRVHQTPHQDCTPLKCARWKAVAQSPTCQPVNTTSLLQLHAQKITPAPLHHHAFF